MSERLHIHKYRKSTKDSLVSNQSKLLDKNRKPLVSRPPLIQTKLTINQPGDEYEQEADRVAEQVMRMPDPLSVPQSPVNSRSKEPSIQNITRNPDKDIQRKEDDEEEEEIIQMKQGSLPYTADRQTDVPPVVHEVLSSPGVPLDPATRAYMEPRFGHDFSRVKVHSGPVAEQSAREVNSNAYTVGHNIVFGAGRFAPGTHEGRRLIAHELTHVVQQSLSNENDVSQSDDKRGRSPISGISTVGIAIQRDTPRQSAMEEERNRFPWVGRIHGTYSAALRRWPYKDPKDPHAGTDADLPMGTLVEVLERRGGWLHVRVSVGSDISLSRRLHGSKEVKGYVSQEQIELVVSGTGCMSCPFFCGYDKSKPLNTYNCAGLAFRTYVPHYLPETKEVLAKQPEVNCSIPCSQVGMIKFWLWEYDGHVEDSTQKGPTVHDFHIVGGPTIGDKLPKDSAEFYSKNNHRKVYGPSTAPSFRPPAREQATSDNELEIPEVDNNGNPVVYFMRYNFKETCYCFPCPKNLDDALW